MVPLSENSIRVLNGRYLLRNNQGLIIETPDEMFHRVANAVACAEAKWSSNRDVSNWAEKFYKVMSSLLFLPNSPTLMNAGTPVNQLSACFVLPVEDNLTGIFDTLKNAALIQQSGGGTGFNFSHLRPKGDFVSAGSGKASGPVSFMKIFDSATEYVKQGGKRRGANMGILDISHPDIEEFIESKRKPNTLSNFNISVGISDFFMQALENGHEWNLIHPNTKAITKTIPAKKIWDAIVKSAWQTGDPGLIFLDTINFYNPTPDLGNIEATNPCGEVPLLSFESCNLGSVNLSKIILLKNGTREIDWHLLEEVVHIGVRFLDNIIEINNYIIPEIKEISLGNRKIGLGVMGWAELLMLLEIPYDSGEAVRLGGQLMQFIQQKSMQASEALAKERSVFPNFMKSIYCRHQPLRNATRTSIAPTGTISIIADTSSSVEPLFALAFKREHVLNEETLFSVNRYFIDYLKSRHLYTNEIKERITADGTTENIKNLSVEAKQIFKTAMEIEPYWHLQHQLAFQQFTDNAVSKTINLPEQSAEKEVDQVFRMAWRHKAKGITIYRNNTKEKQVLRTGIPTAAQVCKVCMDNR